MTEKRFIVNDRWIKDNCIEAFLNIDFNTITDANLCCELLNQIEKEKRNNGKLASKLLKENEQLKKKLQKERTSHTKQHLKWSNKAEQQIKELSEENKQLKRKNMIYKDKIRGLMK